MAGSSSGNPAPAWAIPVAIVALVAIIGFVAWKSLGKNPSAGEGPPMQVKAGMYDIKKEAAEGHLGNGLKGGALAGPTGN